jgi:hypothetical protein
VLVVCRVDRLWLGLVVFLVVVEVMDMDGPGLSWMMGYGLKWRASKACWALGVGRSAFVSTY